MAGFNVDLPSTEQLYDLSQQQLRDELSRDAFMRQIMLRARTFVLCVISKIPEPRSSLGGSLIVTVAGYDYRGIVEREDGLA